MKGTAAGTMQRCRTIVVRVLFNFFLAETVGVRASGMGWGCLRVSVC